MTSPIKVFSPRHQYRHIHLIALHTFMTTLRPKSLPLLLSQCIQILPYQHPPNPTLTSNIRAKAYSILMFTLMISFWQPKVTLKPYQKYDHACYTPLTTSLDHSHHPILRLDKNLCPLKNVTRRQILGNFQNHLRMAC